MGINVQSLPVSERQLQSSKLDPYRLMIRRLGRRIDAMPPEAVRQPFGDEDEIEALRLLDEIDRVDADRGGMEFAGMQNLPGVAKTRFAAVKGGKDLRSLGRRGGEIHVAAQERLRGSGKYFEGAACFLRQQRARRHGARLGMQAADGVDLGLALALRVILEVRGHHPQRPDIGALHNHFNQDALHAGRSEFGRPGQEMPPHLADGQAGKDGVAEPAAATAAIRHVGCGAADCGVAGQAGRQFGDLVLAAAAGQAGEVGCDFLQTDDVEIAQLADGLEDAREVDPAVHAAPPLDVPAQQLHGMPRSVRPLFTG